MRIGFITERMLRGFGVDLVIDRVAGGLAANGHEVTVYASVTDETLDSGGYRLKLIPTPAYSFFPRYELSAQRHLRFINEEKNDVYFIETFPYFSYLPRLKTPAVAVDHGVSSTEGFPWKIRANFAYLNFLHQHLYLRYARRIVTVSEYLRQELPAGLRSRTSVIYNGADHYPQRADDSENGRQSLRSELGVAGDEVLMLYVGRLAAHHQPYKGTAQLVDMYRRLRTQNPAIRLLMAGFGGEEERAWLEGEGVLVLANAPAEQMPAIFAASDIYVTASRWEGFDLPIVEAQSFGKPVVGLKIGAHPEVVADGSSGFLGAGMDEMEKAIMRLAGDEGLRADMGAAALANSERFRWDRAVKEYQQLLGKVA